MEEISVEQFKALTARKPKYRNRRVRVGKRTFHSQGEADRWIELLALKRAGEITQLKPQRVFLLHGPEGSVIGRYYADFTYRVKATGELIVEDFKGYATRLFKWKKKHFEDEYGIKITEVKRCKRTRS